MTDKNKEIGPVFTGNDSEWIDADYQVTARETRWVEKKIFEVIRQKSIAPKIFPTMKIPKGMKEWIIEIDVETEPPLFTDNFLKENLDESRKAEYTFYPVFMHKDYRIAMTDSDAVANSQFHNLSLSSQTVRNLSGTMVDFKEKVIWRGYDISGRANAAPNDQGSIDTASKGILNTAGISAFAAGIDNDANITAAGDGPASLSDAAGVLVADDFYGPYVMFFTPKVYACLLDNANATTGRSDLTLMNELLDTQGNKITAGYYVTKHLLPTVEASGTEANMVVIDPKDPNGNPTIMIGEEYPLSNLPQKPGAAVAASGKIIWAGISAVLRPKAIALEEDIVYA